MALGKWSEISTDSEIWKKLAIGGTCLLLVLPAPLAFGAVFQDLETELGKLKEEVPPGEFTDMDNIAGLFGKGIAPSIICFLSLMLVGLPSIVILLSLGHLYAWFASEHGMSTMSLLLTSGLGLVALIVQFLFALIFPVALAQYARGVNIKQAMHPMAGLGIVFELGAPFWNKAAGYWLFLVSTMGITVFEFNFFVDLLIRLCLAFLGFASLVVASRYAAGQIQTKL